MTEQPIDVRQPGVPRARSRSAGTVLPALLLIALGAVACSGQEGGDEERAGLPATWTIPDDVCDRLDLVGIVTDSVATPPQPPRATTDDVEADRAGCAATAGGGFEITVELRVSEDGDQHALDVGNAQKRLSQPSTWSAMGDVDEVPVADDLAPWAGSSETAAYALTRLSADPDLEDALDLTEVLVADDDNLVAVVTVSSSTTATQASAPDEAAAALAAATAAVPEALER